MWGTSSRTSSLKTSYPRFSGERKRWVHVDFFLFFLNIVLEITQNCYFPDMAAAGGSRRIIYCIISSSAAASRLILYIKSIGVFLLFYKLKVVQRVLFFDRQESIIKPAADTLLPTAAVQQVIGRQQAVTG